MVFLNCLIDESTAIEEQINKEAGLDVPNKNKKPNNLSDGFALSGLLDVEPTEEDVKRFEEFKKMVREKAQQRKELKLKKQQQKVGKR
jgi:hypothetical protein